MWQLLKRGVNSYPLGASQKGVEVAAEQGRFFRPGSSSWSGIGATLFAAVAAKSHDAIVFALKRK